MGAAALTLSRGQYAIHGTNAPGWIGGLYRMDASACSTRTSWICISVLVSARASS